jgi:hypothetical protein
MLLRVYEIDGILVLLLALLLGARLISRHLVLPRIVYRLGGMMAFCAWLVFAASGGSASPSGQGLVVLVRDYYLFLAPFLLPLQAGYLAWLGTGSASRWLLLELIMAAALLPIVAALVIHLLQP